MEAIRYNFIDRLSYAIVLFSIALVGSGFVLMGMTLFPVVGVFSGLGFFALVYYMYHSQALDRIIEVVLRIPKLSEFHAENRIHGSLPIAILSTSRRRGDLLDFDARTVDASTLRLEHSGAKMLDPIHHYDVNKNGELDLIFHLPITDFNALPESREICVVGNTIDGEPIRGCADLRDLDSNSENHTH
jgi:hypothetical protein